MMPNDRPPPPIPIPDEAIMAEWQVTTWDATLLAPIGRAGSMVPVAGTTTSTKMGARLWCWLHQRRLRTVTQSVISRRA